MFIKYATALVVLASCVVPSARADGGATIATLTGQCTQAMVMNTPVSASLCSNKVVNTAFADGRNVFTFVVKNDAGAIAVISFSGREQQREDQNHSVQPVDLVQFTFDETTLDLDAAGTCSFASSLHGEPTSIYCIATTYEGKFLNRFTSDGHGPEAGRSSR